MANDNIDERIQFLIQSNETLHDDVRELFRTTETLATSIHDLKIVVQDLKVIAQQDGENIRALARIAEAHEHR